MSNCKTKNEKFAVTVRLPLTALLAPLLILFILSFATGTNGKDGEGGPPIESYLYPLAQLESLKNYPSTAAVEDRSKDGVSKEQAKAEIYALLLPDGKMGILIRPISQPEYASFQIQAVGHRIIERQMVARALVSPLVEEKDVEKIAPELISFIKEGINFISGFAVFKEHQ